MRLITRVFVAAIAAFLLVPAWARAAADTPLRVQKVPAIAVDGSLTDWKDVAIEPLEGGMALASVAQDDRYLYVNFNFTDLAVARRVLRSGAIVWVNPQGKHEPDLGLRYRGTDEVQQVFDEMREAEREAQAASGDQSAQGGQGQNPRQQGAYRQRQQGAADQQGGAAADQRRNAGARAMRSRQPLGTLEVMHHAVPDTIVAEGKTADDVAAACKVDEGTFAYEFRIPLKEVAAGAPDAAAGGDRTVAIGIQLNGLTPSEMDSLRAAGGRWRQRRQPQPGTQAPWAAQGGAAAPQPEAGAAEPAPQAGKEQPAPAQAAPAEATAGAAPEAGAGASAQPTPGAGRRLLQPTWFDMTVLLPPVEPKPKQE